VSLTDGLDVLFDAPTVAARVQALGAQITKDYLGKELVVVSVLKGSVIFFADLVRAIELPLEMDFLGVSSYGSSTESTGVVRVTHDLSRSVAGKHVLVVEDIVDTGLTMSYLLANLKTRQPASVRLCSLLHKPARTIRPVPIDFLGFTIEDLFVVGYGLDWAEKLRNVPFIGVVRNP